MSLAEEAIASVDSTGLGNSADGTASCQVEGPGEMSVVSFDSGAVSGWLLWGLTEVNWKGPCDPIPWLGAKLPLLGLLFGLDDAVLATWKRSSGVMSKILATFCMLR